MIAVGLVTPSAGRDLRLRRSMWGTRAVAAKGPLLAALSKQVIHEHADRCASSYAENGSDDCCFRRWFITSEPLHASEHSGTDHATHDPANYRTLDKRVSVVLNPACHALCGPAVRAFQCMPDLQIRQPVAG